MWMCALRLRGELPRCAERCGASGVIVTHDPKEALAISVDRWR